MLLNILSGLTGYSLKQISSIILITVLGGKAGFGDYKVAIYTSMMLTIFLNLGMQTVAGLYLRRYINNQDLPSIVTISLWFSRIILLYGLPVTLGLFIIGYTHHYGFNSLDLHDLETHPATLSLIGAMIMISYKLSALGISAYGFTRLPNLAFNSVPLATAFLAYIHSQIYLNCSPIHAFLYYVCITALATCIFATIFAKKSGWSIKLSHKGTHPDNARWKKIAVSGFFSTLCNQVNICFMLLFCEHFSWLFKEDFVGFIAITLSLINGGYSITLPMTLELKNLLIDLSSTKNQVLALQIHKKLRIYFISFFFYAALLAIFSPQILGLFFNEVTSYEIFVFRIAAIFLPFTLAPINIGRFVPVLLGSTEILKQAYISTILPIILISLMAFLLHAPGMFLGDCIAATVSTVFFIKKMHQSLGFDVFNVFKKPTKVSLT